jgi:hypothetical protein
MLGAELRPSELASSASMALLQTDSRSACCEVHGFFISPMTAFFVLRCSPLSSVDSWRSAIGGLREENPSSGGLDMVWTLCVGPVEPADEG